MFAFVLVAAIGDGEGARAAEAVHAATAALGAKRARAVAEEGWPPRVMAAPKPAACPCDGCTCPDCRCAAPAIQAAPAAVQAPLEAIQWQVPMTASGSCASGQCGAPQARGRGLFGFGFGRRR